MAAGHLLGRDVSITATKNLRERKRLTAGKVGTLTVFTGPASFLPFDPVGVFIDRLLGLAIARLTGT